MFAASKSGAVTAAPSDPYYEYVTMLLTGDGTNGAQNNTFVDSSTNNFTITRNGNTTQGSFSPYGSLWSNYFNGAYIRSGTSISLGTGDFTAECWFYLNAYGTVNNLFNIGDDATSSGLTLLVNNLGNFRIYQNGAYLNNITGTTVPLNTWCHVAIVRSGTTITTYYNGTSINTVTNSANLSGNPVIGAEYNASTYVIYTNAYISNVRLTNTAVYSTTFTPSTTPLTAISGTQLLTCQSNRFSDASSNNATITPTNSPSVQRFSPFNPTASYSTATIGGSGYFDGSGDYLSTPSSGQFQATGNFTISCWIYLTNPSRMWNQILGNYGTASPGNDVIFEIYNDGTINYYFNGNTISSSAGVIKYNAWNYISLVRSSSTCTGYVNGVSVATTSYSGQVGQASASYNIGRSGPGNPSDSTLGYISDVRFVDGTAITTVPTSPLTAVSGTNLLCNFTNAGIPDYAMMNDLETVGNAQVSTSVKKFGTGSIKFDGTGDYLTTKTVAGDFSFGTGDFTVEGWVRLNRFDSAAGNEPGVFHISNTFLPSNLSGLGLGITTSSWYLYYGGSYTSFSASPVIDTWYYFAIVKYSGTTNLYINGTSIGSVSDSKNYSMTTCTLGGIYDTSYLMDGYIDDFRITKGYARYTANFTPPTAALPTY